MSSFTKLKYPKGFLINLKKKAVSIRNRPKTENKKDVRYVSVPTSKVAESIADHLEMAGVKVALTTGRKIGEMVTKKGTKEHADKSVVYQVPCGTCNKSYIGETGRGIETRLKEHRRDVRNDMDHSAFVVHAHKTSHLPNWEGATVLASCRTKGYRKAAEAAYIAMNDTINTRVGFIKWAKPAAIFGIKDVTDSKFQVP